MSRNSYGTFLDSLNTDKTELRSISEATGADEVMCVGLLYPAKAIVLTKPSSQKKFSLCGKGLFLISESNLYIKLVNMLLIKRVY